MDIILQWANDDSLIFKEADKGGAVVMTDKEDYLIYIKR